MRQALIGVVVALTGIHVPVLRGLPLAQEPFDPLAHDRSTESDQEIRLQVVLVLLADAFDHAVDRGDEGRVVQIAGGFHKHAHLRKRSHFREQRLHTIAPQTLAREDHHLLACAELADEPARMIREDEGLCHHRGDEAGVQQAPRLWAFIGQRESCLLDRSVQRLLERHVHMHWATNWQQRRVDGFVDEPSTVPTGKLIVRIAWQLHAPFHVQGEHTLLTDRLSLTLVHPFFRTIGGDDKERHALVERFCDGGAVVQYGTTTRADQGNGSVKLLRHTQREEGGAALINDLQALDAGLLGEGDHQRCTARSRTDHRVAHTLGGA